MNMDKKRKSIIYKILNAIWIFYLNREIKTNINRDETPKGETKRLGEKFGQKKKNTFDLFMVFTKGDLKCCLRECLAKVRFKKCTMFWMSLFNR